MHEGRGERLHNPSSSCHEKGSISHIWTSLVRMYINNAWVQEAGGMEGTKRCPADETRAGMNSVWPEQDLSRMTARPGPG